VYIKKRFIKDYEDLEMRKVLLVLNRIVGTLASKGALYIWRQDVKQTLSVW